MDMRVSSPTQIASVLEMTTDIPADVSYLGGVWCEGVLYGIHLVVFGLLCNVFIKKSATMGFGSAVSLLAFSSCMFILSTTHVALALQSLFQGFIYQRSEESNTFYRENVFPNRKAVYIINTLLGDSLLVWRAFILWRRNWKICGASFILLLATTVCGIKTIVANALASHSSVFDETILSWVTSTFVLNIATQITATTLIVCRIYRGFYHSPYRSRYVALVWLIVESGAMYTAAAIIQLITYLLNMNAGVILEFILAQLSAIAPGLIVVRVALGVAYDSNGTIPYGTALTTFNAPPPTAVHSSAVKKGYFETRESDTLAISPSDEDISSRHRHQITFASSTSV